MSPAEASVPVELKSFGSGLNAAVIGTSNGIGAALVNELTKSAEVSKVLSLSRSRPAAAENGRNWLYLDLESEASIAEAAAAAQASVKELHLVIVATGVLHAGDALQPEKTWRSLSPEALETAFRINATGPALVAKHFLPLLSTERKSVFAALSARVGSISDNHLGGWYAYRASKAALNMLIKTLSIELARRNTQALCVGLHPGTVDTALSKPFQSNVPGKQLFTPQYSAQRLLSVIDGLSPADTGELYAWDGNRVPS